MGRHVSKSWSVMQSWLRQFELAANALEWCSWLQNEELMLKPTYMLALEGPSGGSPSGKWPLRHVRVGALWIQEFAEDREISVKTVNGSDNAGNILTKKVQVHFIDKY